MALDTSSAAARKSGGAVVACTDVTRAYRQKSSGVAPWWGQEPMPTVTAVDGVSLAVHPGEIVGLQGPSGSGKSTLLHLLGALDTPTSGSVRLADQEVATLGDRERARLRLDTVGIVFQRFHLLPSLSARANVALPLVEAGVGKRTRRERATTLLESVGLGDRTGHRPGQLSGGEQQRVAIARALVTDPPLLIADEPTGELDTETGRAVLDLIADVASDGRAVVLASHDEPTLGIADRIITLRDGRRTDA